MLVMPQFGAEQDGLVNDLGLGASYQSTETGSGVELTITIATTGGWTVTVGAGDALGGTPTSGTWLVVGSASDYEVMFVPTNEVGSPSIVNDAATFTAISANRAIVVSKAGAAASADVQVVIRRIVNPTREVSDTTELSVDGSP